MRVLGARRRKLVTEMNSRKIGLGEMSSVESAKQRPALDPKFTNLRSLCATHPESILSGVHTYGRAVV